MILILNPKELIVFHGMFPILDFYTLFLFTAWIYAYSTRIFFIGWHIVSYIVTQKIIDK